MQLSQQSNCSARPGSNYRVMFTGSQENVCVCLLYIVSVISIATEIQQQSCIISTKLNSDVFLLNQDSVVLRYYFFKA